MDVERYAQAIEEYRSSEKPLRVVAKEFDVDLRLLSRCARAQGVLFRPCDIDPQWKTPGWQPYAPKVGRVRMVSQYGTVTVSRAFAGGTSVVTEVTDETITIVVKKKGAK